MEETTVKKTDNPDLGKARSSHIKAAEYNVNTSNVSLDGGGARLFIKRALAKLIRIFFGWYVRPPKERQTSYNELMHETAGHILEASEAHELALDAQKKAVTELEIELDGLKTENQELKNALEEQKKSAMLLEERVTAMNASLNVLSAAERRSVSAQVGATDIEYIKSKLNISYDPTLIEDGLVDYFDFEDKYRGSRECIKERQLQYLPYLKTEHTDGAVLELGFGRGEILEMLRDNGVKCIGVDCYPPFVDYCREKGFSVSLGDALTYLTACEDESLNGIVLSQVAEHVNTDYLYQMIKTGYRKLKAGCCFIIETPNPESLATYLNFNLDGSHVKPVHYLALDYVFRSFGYSETVRLKNEYSEHPYALEMQKALIDGCEDAVKKNFYTNLKNVLFGAMDLTVIARK